MFSIGYVLLVLQSQLHNDDAWRQQASEWCIKGCFAIHSEKPRTVPVVFVAEGSFDELCDPGCPRGVLLGIHLPILLGMVRRHENSFAVENLGIVQCVAGHCHAKRNHQ